MNLKNHDKEKKATSRGTSLETAARNEAEDARNVACLEHLWRPFRDGAHGELAAALDIAPELVKARFLKDRSLGRTSS